MSTRNRAKARRRAEWARHLFHGAPRPDPTVLASGTPPKKVSPARSSAPHVPIGLTERQKRRLKAEAKKEARRQHRLGHIAEPTVREVQLYGSAR